MKKLSILSIVAVTFSLVTGCNVGESQTSQLGPGASGLAHDRPLLAAAASSSGRKKVGQYVWVWQTGSISASRGGQVEADCPLNHIVINGGYALKSGFIYELTASKPNTVFDGWIIGAIPGYSRPATLTVYAVCSPTT
jgi:hypothetical protein